MRASGSDVKGDKYQTDWITTLLRIQKDRWLHRSFLIFLADGEGGLEIIHEIISTLQGTKKQHVEKSEWDQSNARLYKSNSMGLMEKKKKPQYVEALQITHIGQSL